MVPLHAAASVRLRELAIPLDRVPVVAPDTPARAALERGVPVAVAVDGQIIGIIGLDEMRRAAGDDAVKLAAESSRE